MRTLIKWRFRLSFCPSWKGLVVLGYKTLNIFLSFFLSFFFLGTITCCLNTCCFKDTSYHLFLREEESLKKKTKLKRRRRRMMMIVEGERRDDSLWGVIVKCDDICFTHILPRLNGTDLKFLYEVNKETRKLIKRSSRASDLKKTFKVREMSSMSTLDVAWEHFPWGKLRKYNIKMDESDFCLKVAETNKLELLKWIREEKKCEWDKWTINAAAEQGNLEMVKYCVAKKCPINAFACVNAARNGHLEILKYLRETAKAPWAEGTAYFAAQKSHLHILEYLVERKFDKYNEYACRKAAENGHLDCLQYLHETAKAPWDSEAVRKAHKNDQTECLQYLLDNNCPLPFGWRYEHGELHTI